MEGLNKEMQQKSDELLMFMGTRFLPHGHVDLWEFEEKHMLGAWGQRIDRALIRNSHNKVLLQEALADLGNEMNTKLVKLLYNQFFSKIIFFAEKYENKTSNSMLANYFKSLDLDIDEALEIKRFAEELAKNGKSEISVVIADNLHLDFYQEAVGMLVAHFEDGKDFEIA